MSVGFLVSNIIQVHLRGINDTVVINTLITLFLRENEREVERQMFANKLSSASASPSFEIRPSS